MLAKTFKGLEPVLAEELTNLGADNIQIERRAVSFEGDLSMLYKTNLWLRTASRILKPIYTFDANDADEVYEQVKQINWEEWMGLSTTFAIDSTVYSDTFRHSHYVTYRVKDAIADFFNEKYGKRPSVKVSNPDLYINVHIANNTVTISLDSSGESLHKRGWRVGQTEAPINEALAAGLILQTGWRGETDFVDPMCGSGTLLVEAAMIALNIPPGIYRTSFAFEKWRDFDRELFDSLYNDDSQERVFTHKIYGSDQSHYAIQTSEKNIKSAGLQRFISLKQCAFQTLDMHEEKALIVTNPPYGERLKEDDIFQLYEDLGNLFKRKFMGSTAWVISSNEDALKHIGLKPSAREKTLNGELECQFVEYELFSGRHADHQREKKENGGGHSMRETEYQSVRREKKTFRRNEDIPFKKERKPFDGERKTFAKEKTESFHQVKKTFRDREREPFDGGKRSIKREGQRGEKREHKPFRTDEKRAFEGKKPFQKSERKSLSDKPRRPYAKH